MNPLVSFIKSKYSFITKNLKFIDQNKVIYYNDSFYTVFREFNYEKQPTNYLYFIIRFTPSNKTIKQNILFSKRVMWFFLGFTGLLSKKWCVNYETEECLGIYTFKTEQDAVNYSKSYAYKNMKKRSKEGSISYEIVSNINYKEFNVNNLSLCGIPCYEDCPIYNTDTNKKDAASVLNWFKENNWIDQHITLKEFMSLGKQCHGCKEITKKHWSSNCKILNCNIDQNTKCTSCTTYPCEILINHNKEAKYDLGLKLNEYLNYKEKGETNAT